MEWVQTVPAEGWGVLVLLAAAVAAVGFALGRRTGTRAEELRQLGSALEEAHAQTESVREELEGYRGRVADHFTRTSEKLHDLTLQYRAVYEHLAAGASELCPEGFQQLDGGLGLDALPEGEPESPGEEAAEAPEVPAEEELATARATDGEEVEGEPPPPETERTARLAPDA